MGETKENILQWKFDVQQKEVDWFIAKTIMINQDENTENKCILNHKLDEKILVKQQIIILL